MYNQWEEPLLGSGNFLFRRGKTHRSWDTGVRKCSKSPDHVNYAKEFIFYLEVWGLFSIKDYNVIHTVCGHCGYKRGVKEDGGQ